jgi:hypothetical protein
MSETDCHIVSHAEVPADIRGANIDRTHMSDVKARPYADGIYFNMIDHTNEMVHACVERPRNESHEDTLVVEPKSELAEAVCRHAVKSKAVRPETELPPGPWSRIAKIDLVVFAEIARKCTAFERHLGSP